MSNDGFISKAAASAILKYLNMDTIRDCFMILSCYAHDRIAK